MKYDGSKRRALANDPAVVAQRFWAKVQKTDGCWLWSAALEKNGYGWFRAFGKSTFAHRVAWRLTHGTWPTLALLHSCDNRPCVNPEHLREGTQIENVADAVARNRVARGEALSVLRESDIRAVRQRAAAGETQGHIAQSLGLRQSTISRIVTGKRWSHVA